MLFTVAYELMLMQLALAAKKPVEGLESAKFQREVAEKLPLDAQAQLLLEMAAGPEKAAEQFKKMIAVYKEQDSEKLYEFTNSQMGGTDLETPLVANRNKTWIPKIESMIKEKPTFIAVGAGHLGGKDGLVNSLRVLGYKVEAVKL